MVFFDLEPKSTGPSKTEYDVIIVGAGPAGLGAAIYSGRAGLSTLVIEKNIEGGQILLTDVMENYPGYGLINSNELAQRFKEHADMFGTEFDYGEVVKVELAGEQKLVYLDNGKAYKSKVIIIATGASPRRLGVPGEDRFISKGVSYCAVCDGAFFTNKNVAVVGGGDSAVDEALYLSRIAAKVTIIHRRDKLRAVKSLQEKAFNNPKIDFIWDTIVKEIKGTDKVESLILQNLKTGEIKELPFDGVFIFIGLNPNSGIFKDIVDVDENGFIKTNEDMETNVDGIFAAGDVRVKSVRQVITAVADGAIAATIAARKYFE
ncbi:MAG: thioredoxin reductase [Thermotogaceae bacterium]|jgi:thioredoxin reductase (NADPH)|nr:thioredoxin reductase [Thermotogaceae bacterium]MDN5338444.1 thioredoxin reductase [Thermotogaceae bacterium]